jgi:hypothetical protein
VNDDLSINANYTKLSPESYADIISIVPAEGKCVMVYQTTPLSTADDKTYRTHAATIYPSGSGVAMSGKITLGEGSYSYPQNAPIPRAEYVSDSYVAVMLYENRYNYFTLKLIKVSGYNLSVSATGNPSPNYGVGFLSNPALCGEHIILPMIAEASYSYNVVIQPFLWSRVIKKATSRIDGITETKATTSAKGKVAMINKWGV